MRTFGLLCRPGVGNLQLAGQMQPAKRFYAARDLFSVFNMQQ